MPHKKRRAIQNIMEETSVGIVRNKLPKEWVMHQYAPDYGVDFVVETFEFIDDNHTIAETLGEFFFVQLKSVNKVKEMTLTVKDRYNVEKYSECDSGNEIKIDVIKYTLDINEIYTIQSMGYAVPTVLLLVDLESEEVYFLCINDYIEKILLINSDKLDNSSSITLYIPKTNSLDNDKCIYHLGFLARRSKLFGAFNKFNYQRHELNYNVSKEIIINFISIIKKYDFWNTKLIWPPLEGMYDELLKIEKFLISNDIEEKIQLLKERNIPDSYFVDDTEDLDDFFIDLFVLSFWDKLCNLGRIYEEICKEWFLPTYFWSELY